MYKKWEFLERNEIGRSMYFSIDGTGTLFYRMTEPIPESAFKIARALRLWYDKEHARRETLLVCNEPAMEDTNSCVCFLSWDLERLLNLLWNFFVKHQAFIGILFSSRVLSSISNITWFSFGGIASFHMRADAFFGRVILWVGK